MESYFVYMHRTPSNKVYIGITRQSNPNLRWQNGKGYVGNAHFCNAINKYGWDNIEHIILFSGLSQIEAYEKEIELIAQYNSSDPNFGYNHTLGGDSNPMDLAENKLRLSKILKEQRGTPEWKEFISKKLKGHVVSDETRRKISVANTGRTVSAECIARRVESYKRSFTEERRRKIADASRHRVFTEEQRRKMSEARKGIPMSDEAKRKLSEVKKQKVLDGYSLIWVHNDVKEHSIDPADLDNYLKNGYTQGRLMKKHIFMHKGNDEIMVSEDEIFDKQSQGYTVGTSDRRKESIRNGVRTFTYLYKGISFDTAELLAIFLRDHGYPKIVSSTITEMCRKGKTTKYPDILDNLTRIRVK